MKEHKDELAHLPLAERVALRAKAIAELAAEVTGVDVGQSEADRLRDGWREADQQHARDIELMFYFGAVMSDWHNAEDKRVCACVSDEQASKLGSGFTRPQCTVHPPSTAGSPTTATN